MAEKLSNFEKIVNKRDQISALFSTQIPPDDWPDAIDHLTIGLVANKCTKLGKTGENLKKKKVKILPGTQPSDILITGLMP